MIIGVPKEIKTQENRVGLTIHGVSELIQRGHQVLVETNAGMGIGETDAEYQSIGASIIKTPAEIFEQSEMIIKVKEPQQNECKMLRKNQILFTYLHLAADKNQTALLLESECIAIAYETITDQAGTLPLLAPMSEVAGRLSIQEGMSGLKAVHGGAGILLGGVPGVPSANVLIIGGGVVGLNAAKMAVGCGAKVSILDKSINRLRYLDDIFQGRVETLYSSSYTLDKKIIDADLVIGGVLLPGAEAPKLVKKHHLKTMKKGAVIVDVAIDQGGCCESSKVTTHDDPMYIEDGIVHYCVGNIPGAVPRTSTYALTNVTLPFVLDIANKGYQQALSSNKHFLNGLNIFKGAVSNKAVASSLDYEFTAPDICIARQ